MADDVVKYPNMEALNDAGHLSLFGRPLREALADGLIDGSIQITNVTSQMSKGSLPELTIGFVVVDQPGRTPPELPTPQIPVTLDLKPGDICPVCVGLGVTCVYCEGEGVVIDREHYDPLPKDGGWGNRWATAGVQASDGSGGVLTKPPPPRPTHGGKRVLPAAPTVNVQVGLSTTRDAFHISAEMMTSDGQAVGMSHTMDRMQLADPMLKESMIQLLAEKLARNLGGRYAEEKIVPIIAKALHEELG